MTLSRPVPSHPTTLNLSSPPPSLNHSLPSSHSPPSVHPLPASVPPFLTPSQVLKDLVSLLSSSPEPRTQAVACHDLGQFIAAHPSGRSVALDLKAKEAVIKLLDSPDADVRKHALLALQKLLLSAKYASFMK